MAIAWGMLSAAGAFFINTNLCSALSMDFHTYSRLIAPAVEELLKAMFITYVIIKGKAGFMIDASILGFSIGAGFSLIENIFYLYNLGETDMLLWIIRGFGTAVMHAGTTGLIALLAMLFLNKKQKINAMAFIPGILAAILIHAFYNMFWLPPQFMAIIFFIGVPLLFIILFNHSENSLRKWLEIEFAAEIELLSAIRKGVFTQTKAGSYFITIKNRFPKELIVDMLCFMELYLELSIIVKRNMLLKESGIDFKPDTNIKEKITEMLSLKKSIGKTGFLALSPILRFSQKDLWKLSQIQ